MSNVKMSSSLDLAYSPRFHMTKILVADDHLLIFNGIQTLFEDESSYEVLDESVRRLADLLPALQRYVPDILLLDINIRGENALDLLPDIKQAFPKIRGLPV